MTLTTPGKSTPVKFLREGCLLSIMRWDPLDLGRFRDDINRLVESTFQRMPFAGRGAWEPDIDLYQTDKDVVVEVELPGVEPDNMEVSIAHRAVTIFAETKPQDDFNRVDNEGYYFRERRWGKFVRTIAFPVEVLPEKARATYRHGVLKIVAPKVETATRRTLPITVEDGGARTVAGTEAGAGNRAATGTTAGGAGDGRGPAGGPAGRETPGPATTMSPGEGRHLHIEGTPEGREFPRGV